MDKEQKSDEDDRFFFQSGNEKKQIQKEVFLPVRKKLLVTVDLTLSTLIRTLSIHAHLLLCHSFVPNHLARCLAVIALELCQSTSTRLMCFNIHCSMPSAPTHLDHFFPFVTCLRFSLNVFLS